MRRQQSRRQTAAAVLSDSLARGSLVTDSLGGSARDVIELKPLEIYDTTQVSSVLLEPSVLGPRGRPVNGLAIADFAVTENGEPQVVDLVTPDTIPAVYTLLVDSSQSMSRRMDFVRDAAGQLPVHLRNRDRIVVVPFSRTLSAVTGPTQDRDTISGAIAAIRASGGTAILDCLSQAVTRLSVTKDRHIVVLITDGYDENSTLSFEQALEAIKSTKTTVYVIAIGGVAGISLKGEELLRRLATETGGRAFFPSRDFQLADMHQLIAEDVQQRYVLTYTPTNQKLDGTWRAIRLTAKNPEYKVKVRTGYFAPSPPPVRPQIELTVRDLNREFIDVTPNDLEVFEDGVEQKVDAFEEALFGEEEGWKYMDALHENIAQYTHSGSKPCNMASSGEFVVGISFEYRANANKAKGAPIDLVFPKEGLGWDLEAFGIHKGTKKLDAAKKLADWASSKDAMLLYGKNFAITAQPGVAAPLANVPKDYEARLVKMDFAWAADPDYAHVTAQVPGGPLLHFIYEEKGENAAGWKDLPGYMVKHFQYMAKHFGAYPYPHFTIAESYFGWNGNECAGLVMIDERAAMLARSEAFRAKLSATIKSQRDAETEEARKALDWYRDPDRWKRPTARQGRAA